MYAIHDRSGEGNAALTGCRCRRRRRRSRSWCTRTAAPGSESQPRHTWRLSKHRRAPPGIRGRKQGHGPRRRTEKDGALTRPLQLTHLRLGGSLRSPRTIRSFLSSSFLDAATIASRPAERLRTESFSLVDCRAARCSHPPESSARPRPAIPQRAPGDSRE